MYEIYQFKAVGRPALRFLIPVLYTKQWSNYVGPEWAWPPERRGGTHEKSGLRAYK